jgi:CBS domain-containing protein
VDVAVEIMNSNDVRRLPVLSDNGRLIGIITKFDAMLAIPQLDEYGTPTGETPKVRKVMSDYVYTVGPDDTVADAAELMLHHSIGGVPVVDGREVVGIVTESDLFKFLTRELAVEASE